MLIELIFLGDCYSICMCTRIYESGFRIPGPFRVGACECWVIFCSMHIFSPERLGIPFFINHLDFLGILVLLFCEAQKEKHPWFHSGNMWKIHEHKPILTGSGSPATSLEFLGGVEGEGRKSGRSHILFFQAQIERLS